MTLYLIGIGLDNEKDITVKGLDIVKRCDKVYLEHYTSILSVSVEKLEEFYGKEVIIADRDLVESFAEEKLLVKDSDIALLIVGDVFGATTHTDLFIRAKELGIDVEIVNNASILNAIGIVGLELYKYGKTTSIVFPQKNWLPHTPYDVIKNNLALGLHTLCLLDIKVAEPSPEDMRKKLLNPSHRPQSVPPHFMKVSEGLEALQMIEKERGEGIITDNLLVVGIARIGQSDYKIKSGKLKEIIEYDFGAPLHSLIIPGKLHDIEEKMLQIW